VPFSIEVIDRHTITNFSNSLSIAKILNTQAGIIVNNRYNLSQGERITVRGIGARAQFGIRGVKIFLDGIPLTFSDGQAQLNNLDIRKMERVEILKGPSSVLYGNSLGGAIFFTSRIDKRKVLSVTPEITFGSFGLNRYSLNSTYNFSENSNISIGANNTESKGFRNHSEARYYGLNLISNIYLSKQISVSLVSNYYNSPFLLNPGTLNKFDSEINPTKASNSAVKYSTAKKVEQLQNGINLVYNMSDHSQIKSTIYSVTRSLENSIPGKIIQLERFFGGIRIEYIQKLRLFNRSLKFLSGIDYDFQYDERQEWINDGTDKITNINPSNIFKDLIYSDKLIDQDEIVKSFGIFSHFHFRPTDDLSVFSGFRFDEFMFEVKEKLGFNLKQVSNKIKMNNFSFMLGFNQKLSNHINIFGNLSTGFQTPTTNELSNNPFGIGGFNKKLKSEHVNNFELGVKGLLRDLNIFSQVSIYYMDFSNLLIGYQSESEETFYRNAGKATNFGLETKAEFYIHKNFKIFSSYTLMNFRFNNYIATELVNGGTNEFQLANNYAPGIPKSNFSFSIEYHLIENLLNKFVFRWVDRYFANDFNGPITNSFRNKSDYINDSYYRLDFSSSYTLNYNSTFLTIEFEYENILDERYNDSTVPNAFGNKFFEPAAGRSWYLNLSIGI